MRILSLEYEDKSRQWKLERMEFNPLTLIIGASGVGKTQVLHTIMQLKSLTLGGFLPRVRWNIEFSTLNGKRFRWMGECSRYLANGQTVSVNGTTIQTGFLQEKLWCNDEELASRHQGAVFLHGKQTIKLPANRSILDSLQAEDDVYDAFHAFQIIKYTDATNPRTDLTMDILPDHGLSELNSVEKIRNSKFALRIKLWRVAQVDYSLYQQIVSTFKGIFPFVEDIRLMAKPLRHEANQELSQIVIDIKEVGIGRWIAEKEISSGMYRTLLQIAELMLLPNGSVVLIDEFENSLGTNCIDEVTSLMFIYGRDMQFILTSHHHYIINQISHTNWKLLTRKRGVVTAHDVEEFGFGKSKHQAFMQLINLDEYEEGVMV